MLDVNKLNEKNNRFLLISATILRELHDLYQWDELHESYRMTIPSSYIGHKEFLKMGLIQEFYSLDSLKDTVRWVHEDILEHYKEDFRVHLVRVNPKTILPIQQACQQNSILFRNHTTADRLTEEDINEFFEQPLTRHIVIAVKGLLRRANLIPNAWKLKIGATHELYTAKVDNNVQTQGFPGRMTGYWRDVLESKTHQHLTGPHRTSIKAIEQYEEAYENPFQLQTYHTAHFSIRKGKVSNSASTMLAAKHIANLKPRPFLGSGNIASNPIIVIDLDAESTEYCNEHRACEVYKAIVRKHSVAYDKYKKRLWKMDTEDKYSKWGGDGMLKQGCDAKSTSTNIDNHHVDILMMYLFQSKLILSPWSGGKLSEEH